ncbi:uncharacterized protein ACJ7VT_001783 [Polymixia lowei]
MQVIRVEEVVSPVSPQSKKRKMSLMVNTTKGQQRNDYCSVPQCLVSSRFWPSVSFHPFPADEDSRKKWLVNIRRESLKTASYTKVCSFHFKNSDYVGEGTQRRLKQHAVPSLFNWNDYGQTEPDEETSSETDRPAVYTLTDDHSYCRVPGYSDVSLAHMDHCHPVEENERLMHSARAARFGILRFADSDQAIRLYTRFPTYNHLMAFWHLIEPAVAKKVHFPVRNKRKELAQPGRLPPLSSIDEFFLFMTRLVQGLDVLDLSVCFMVEKSTVIHIIASWSNFLYCTLGSIPMWMSKENVKAHLPVEFECYPDTQVVLDFIEFRCRTPLCHFSNDDLYHAKLESDCTLKALVGMAPHGMVTFVSSLFPGSLSDKEAFKGSGIIPLLTPDTAIMVDKSLKVDDLVPCKVNRLSFLSKEKERVVFNTKQSIALLRMHIDMMFQRVKEYMLFRSVISLSTTRSLNQLFSIACMMANYQNGALGNAEFNIEMM